jgi:membrane protein
MTFLIGLFAGNPAAALFGPIITLMLFFNLFARLILFVAAWIGTAEAPVTSAHERISSRRRRRSEASAKPQSESAEPGEPQSVPASEGSIRSAPGPAPVPSGADAGELADDDVRGHWSRTPGYVAQETAERSVRVGMGAGYVAGAAAGAGFCAAIAYALSKITGRS